MESKFTLINIPVDTPQLQNQCGQISTVYPPGKEERRKRDLPRGYVPWHEQYERRKRLPTKGYQASLLKPDPSGASKDC
jgi:hypothetical protein